MKWAEAKDEAGGKLEITENGPCVPQGRGTARFCLPEFTSLYPGSVRIGEKELCSNEFAVSVLRGIIWKNAEKIVCKRRIGAGESMGQKQRNCPANQARGIGRSGPCQFHGPRLPSPLFLTSF